MAADNICLPDKHWQATINAWTPIWNTYWSELVKQSGNENGINSHHPEWQNQHESPQIKSKVWTSFLQTLENAEDILARHMQSYVLDYDSIDPSNSLLPSSGITMLPPIPAQRPPPTTPLLLHQSRSELRLPKHLPPSRIIGLSSYFRENDPPRVPSRIIPPLATPMMLHLSLPSAFGLYAWICGKNRPTPRAPPITNNSSPTTLKPRPQPLVFSARWGTFSRSCHWFFSLS